MEGGDGQQMFWKFLSCDFSGLVGTQSKIAVLASVQLQWRELAASASNGARLESQRRLAGRLRVEPVVVLAM